MKKIILLVDDDKSERELFREAIRSTDPEIIYYAANDGKQALTLLENNIDYLPQVIFLDIKFGVKCFQRVINEVCRKTSLSQNISHFIERSLY